MSSPQWITSSNLGIYSETYSFSITPLILTYAAAAPASVALINGSLPQGLAWTTGAGNVTITGESTGILVDTPSQFTYRVTDNSGAVCDRTFTILLTAVQLAPDWTGQPQFLGYVSGGSTQQWLVQATSRNGQPVVYSIAQFTPPPGLSIAPNTGVLTYDASPVSTDQTLAFTLRATTGSVYSNLNCTIQVLTVPHLPAWITPQGLAGEATEGEFLETAVQAFDSSGGTMTYALVSSTPSFPFTLTSTGLIYGTVPTLYSLTTYSFVVSATNATGSVSRQFYILATPVTVSTALYWTSSTGDLGTVTDGAYTVLDVSARSIRGTVTHSITGGQLPLTMILMRPEGQIVGFLEYQLRDRTYLFDVTASDGVETITRTFSVAVAKDSNSQFMGMTIPLEGSYKDDYYAFVGNSIQPSWYSMPSTTPQSVLNVPNITWISGLNYTVDDPSTALSSANLNMNTTELMIGPVTNVNVSATSTLFYAPILDQDAGADLSDTIPSGLVIYPPSLENVRTDLISSLGWASDGQGTGAVLYPVVDVASTAIAAVQVVSAGTGFLYAPQLIVTGTGNGAVLSSNLTVVGATVITAGTLWAVGDSISLSVPGWSPAQLSVTAVDAQGGLISLSVIAGGDYSRWPAAPILADNGMGLPSRLQVQLGLLSVTVQSGGSGYQQSSTAVTTSGSEPLPAWQQSWFPYLSIGEVQQSYGGQVYGNYAGQGNAAPTFANLTATESQLYYQRFPLQHAILELQGINWTGDTTFDATTTQFDGGLTAFAEWTEPRNTIFDSDLELFDQGNTRFDDDYEAWQAAAQLTWGLTEFDQDFTIFDLYRTIFDDANPTTHSITLLRRLLRIVTQQVSGNNVVV